MNTLLSILLVVFGLLLGSAVGLSIPHELSYMEKEKVALTWIAEHQQKWKYVLCNVPMD
jgi:hypothetical protein